MWWTWWACKAPEPFTERQTAAAVLAAAEIDRDRLMAHVFALTTKHAQETPYWPPESRYAGMPHTHLDSCAYVEAELRSYGLAPEVESGGTPERSICTPWADIRGTTSTDEVVLLNAHHDAWFMGADDNSTGVAVILEVARALTLHPPERTVRVISFDREEEGLVGAADHVAKHGVDGIWRLVNLDSVGYTDPTPGSQGSLVGLDAPDTADFIAIIAPEYAKDDLAKTLALADELPSPVQRAGVLANGDAHGALITDLLRSDHAPFWDRGVPGVFLTDTTEFRNPRYHTAQDTPDTLDPLFLDQVGELTAGLVAAYATEAE